MPQATGKTYGFGRVSPKSRPSPYTPVHLPTLAPGIAPANDAAAPAARARRRRRIAGVLTVVVVAAASALAAAGFLRAATRASADAAPTAGATLLAQDGESERLARSAFAAASRGARP
jgi:hypothetical protein